MALIKCVECGAEVSDRAAACIKCGNPLRFTHSIADPHASPLSNAQPRGGRLKWIVMGGAVLIGLVMCIQDRDPDGTRAAARVVAQQRDCEAALLSSMGHSTLGYADSQAYDKVVADKCPGLTSNRKNSGR